MTETNEKEERLQKFYMEFQLLSQRIQQLERQNEALTSNLMELMATSQSLDDMAGIKEKTEILVPISSGIYAKADIKDGKSFIVNVGANTALLKDTKSTKELIGNQVAEIKKLQETILGQLNEQSAKAAVLEQEMGKIASEIKEQ